jgi:translation initiation factor 2B subunit (eIF-2B alpha/beta/delta family)
MQKHKLHPAVVALGFSCANGTITGSTHRTVAMLYVLQRVIADFHTPDKQAFSRSLSAHINACVGFLWDECQPACVPQRNSVKWLKGLISAVRFSKQ